MIERFVERARSRAATGVRTAGIFMLVASVGGLILGLLLVDSLTEDFEASIDVSRSAIASIGDTIDVVNDLAGGTSAAIEAASRSASSAADTTRDASVGIHNVADFLDSELPEDIEAIESALPGAIGAADAIDTTLGALSFFGADYSPEEAFGVSLRRVQTALATLPDEIRSQSETLRSLAPSADALADDVEGLAQSLEELGDGLAGVDALTDSYAGTVAEAEAAIDQTGSSLDRTILLLRLLVVLSAAAGVVVGLALISVDRVLGRLVVDQLSSPDRGRLPPLSDTADQARR